MNLIIISSTDIDNKGQFILNNQQQLHCINILKIKLGDILSIGVVNGPKGFGVYINETTNDKKLVIQLLPLSFTEINKSEYLSNLTDENRNYLELIQPYLILLDVNIWKTSINNYENTTEIFITYPKPKKLLSLIENLTIFGINNIYFYHSDLSERSYANSHIYETDKINQAIIKGLEQGKSTRLVNFLSMNMEMSELKKVFENSEDSIIIIAHPYEILNNIKIENLLDLKSIIKKFSKIKLILGPERGFTETELIEFCDNLENVHLVKLGDFILTCELANYCLISQLNLISNNN